MMVSMLVAYPIPFLLHGQSLLAENSESTSNQWDLLPSDAPLETLIESIRSEDGNTSNRAISFIGYRGAEAKEAVPALVKNLEEGFKVESILHSLKDIGPAAVEAIPALFRSFTAFPSNPSSRWIASEALANIGYEAIPILEKGALSSNRYERIWSHAALAKIEGPGSSHFQFLSESMLSPDELISRESVKALTMIGADSQSEIQAIIAALTLQTTPKTDLAVLLAQFGKSASPALPYLVKLLDHSDTSTRYCAAYAISKIGGEETQSAEPKLIRMLEDPESHLHRAAAMALGEIGPTAKSSILPLIKCLDNDDYQIRIAAVEALVKIDPTNSNVIEALIPIMNDDIGHIRGLAADALSKNAPVTTDYINAFIAVSEDSHFKVIGACIRFFKRLDASDHHLIPQRFSPDENITH